MLKKRLLSLSIAVVFALTAVTMPAFADNKNVKGSDTKGKPAFVTEKKDLKDKKVNPNKPVTNLEALKGAVQVYLAKHPDTTIKITDKNVLTLALNYKLITNTDVKNKNFTKMPAKRVQVAMYFAKAMELTTTNTFTFTDAKAIPQAALPYVYAMIDKKLMTVNPDGSFQPNKPVTVGELALIVAGKEAVGKHPVVNNNKVEGIVTAVDNVAHKLTVKKADNTTIVFDIPATAKIEINDADKPDGDMNGILINMAVEVKLENNVVKSVEAKDAKTVVTGVISNIDTTNKKFTLTVGTTPTIYDYNDATTVVKKDGVADVITNVNGLTATVKVTNNLATEILAVTTVTVTTTGIVDAINNTSTPKTLTVKVDSTNTVFEIPATAAVKVNGVDKTAGDLASILKYMTVTVVKVNGIVTSVTAVDTVTVVTGKLINVDAATGIITLRVDDTLKNYNFDGATIFKDGDAIVLATTLYDKNVKLTTKNNMTILVEKH